MVYRAPCKVDKKSCAFTGWRRNEESGKSRDNEICNEIQLLGAIDPQSEYIVHIWGWYMNAEEVHIVLDLGKRGYLCDKLELRGVSNLNISISPEI